MLKPAYRTSLVVIIAVVSITGMLLGCDSGGGMEDSESPPDNDTPDKLSVTISNPDDKSAVSAGNTLMLKGSGNDPDEGVLSGSSLEWSSDVDGSLGTGENVSVANLSPGPQTITLTATDSDGNTASDAADIVVESTGFDIRLHFLSDFTQSQKTTIRDALNPWEAAITGDLEAGFLKSEVAEKCLIQKKGIDDLALVIRISDIDGSGGTLAQAGPCATRTDTQTNFETSASGIVTIDEADISNPDLEQIVTHEVGHALGIGIEQLSGWGSNVARLNTIDPFHGGSNTTAAFKDLGGKAYLSDGVPLANTGGQGTFGGHWREDNFDTELMTGEINSGVDMPLSRVSLAALKDLGYPVDLDAADSYSLPMPQVAFWLAESDATVSSPSSSGENFGLPEGARLGNALVAGSNNQKLWSADPESEIFGSLVQFDVPSSLPTGVTVQNAEIRLLLDGRNAETTNHDIGIFPITESWSEETVTWNNRPAIQNAVQTFDFQSCKDCLQNPTGLATDWVTGSFPNNGVFLYAPDATSTKTFSVGYFSRHADSPLRRPFVGVAAETSTPSLTGKSQSGASGEKIPLGDDIREGIIYGIDSKGKVVRTKRLR
jgi:hypothetical protein